MPAFRRSRLAAAILALTLVSGCSQNSAGNPAGPTGPTGPSGTALSFSVSPIAVGNIEFITALGNLNPPGHTLPTDHVYFYHHLNHQSAPLFEVVAPAGGTVTSIIHHAGDLVYVKVNGSITYYIDHVTLDGTIVQGTTLAAGQRIGVTTSGAFGLDLGVVNKDVTIGFVNPGRYSDNSLHCDKPLTFFTEPLKSTLYGLVNRAGADKDGQINFDQAGSLSGNWFLEGLSASESANANGWPMQLAFARDVNDPSAIRISIGGTLALTGVFSVPEGSPDPAGVSMASGVVAYQLQPGFGSSTGVLLVQMLAGDRMTVEAIPGGVAGSAAFTSSARTYVR